ncbi:MAG: heavy metal-binding domain-containing protein [Rhodospirillales bacterium]
MFSFLSKRKDARIRQLIDGASYEDLPPEVIADLGSHIVITTENAATDLVVEKRLGIISAEMPVAMHLLRPLLERARRFRSGRSPAGQRVLRDARTTCEIELRREALIVKADAVIGVTLDCKQLSGLGRQTFLVTMSGTAIRLAQTGELSEPPAPAIIAAAGE